MKSTLSLASLVAAVAGLGVPACLPSVAGGELPPECQVSADCPVSGQVCEEQVCWGAPPPGHFAALLGPPVGAQPLIVTELPELTIPEDGQFGKVIIQAPVHIGGRVHLNCQAPAFSSCDGSAAVAAMITVLGEPRIPGGPPFVDSTTSDPTTTGNGDSFTLAVPRLSLADPPDTIVITPSDTTPIVPGGPTPAQLAPPLTTKVDAIDDIVGLDVPLGTGQLRTVTGRVTDATGTGVAGMRVSAVGRFDQQQQAVERVSTVAVTDINGYYAIYVAEAALTIVDVVAYPNDNPGLTLRLRDVQADKTSQAVADLRMPAAGKPISVTVPVIGLTGSGQNAPVPGASVQASADLTDPARPTQTTTYEVTATTDTKGNAVLPLIPASGTTLREYTVSIHPQPGTQFASLYGWKIEIGTSNGVLAEIEVPHRVGISGSLLDADGNPAAGVTVSAQPAVSLSYQLDTMQLAKLTAALQLQPPSTTTTADGGYFLWVDPDLAGVAPVYDVDCVPPDGARTPRWTFRDVAVNLIDNNITYDMGARQLPPGRHVRGTVVDPSMKTVEGSEVRIYQVLSDPALCKAASLPSDCVLPAALRAVDRSDKNGVVRLVLPDPAH